MKTDLKPFSVGNATFGDGRLTVIAGPCVIESYEHASMMARECLQRAQRRRPRLRFQIIV